MEELKYEPNILARTLARQDVFVASILTPYPYQDFYWKEVKDGIDKGFEDFSAYPVKNKTYFYDMFDPDHFERTALKILEDPGEVIIIGSEFYRQTIDLLKRCESRNIKTIVMNADISSAPYLAYIGINSFSVGMLTGRIIKSTRYCRNVLIIHLSNNIENSLHLKNKELGVVESIGSTSHINIDSIVIPYPVPAPARLLSILKKKIADQNIDTLYTTTSRAYLFASSLSKLFPELSIIGHDLIENNIKCLAQNQINVLIDQNSYQMGYQSVKTWIDHCILEKKVIRKQYLPLDIIYPENLKFSIGSRKVIHI